MTRDGNKLDHATALSSATQWALDLFTMYWPTNALFQGIYPHRTHYTSSPNVNPNPPPTLNPSMLWRQKVRKTSWTAEKMFLLSLKYCPQSLKNCLFCPPPPRKKSSTLSIVLKGHRHPCFIHWWILNFHCQWKGRKKRKHGAAWTDWGNRTKRTRKEIDWQHSRIWMWIRNASNMTLTDNDSCCHLLYTSDVD